MARSPEPVLAPPPARPRAHDADGHVTRTLATGWQAARAPADSHPDARNLDGLSWMPGARSRHGRRRACRGRGLASRRAL